MGNYEFYYKLMMNQIKKKPTGVLATSLNDEPTTRMLSIVVYDNKIAFQTSTKLIKFSQIQQNSNVSLCFTNINIQGEAKIVDQQVLKNEKFTSLFEEKHKSSYATYSHMKSNRIIEITPKKMVMWGYEDKEPYRIFLNVEEKTARKEMYLHSEED